MSTQHVQIQALFSIGTIEGDIERLKALLAIQNQLELLMSSIVVKAVNKIRLIVTHESAVLNVVIGFPEERQSDGISAQYGVEESQDTLFRPNEIPLNRWQNDLIVFNLVKQSDKTHMAPFTVASKSFTRISPEISLGNRESRIAARVRDSSLFRWTRWDSGTQNKSKALTSSVDGKSTSDIQAMLRFNPGTAESAPREGKSRRERAWNA